MLSRHLAAKWYLKAAELGNVRAQAKIGEMYEFGDGVWADHEKALTWARKAMEHDPHIATVIGNRYSEPMTDVSVLHFAPGVRKELFWYHLGADAGDNSAMLAIGQLWFNRATAERFRGSFNPAMHDYEEASVWLLPIASESAPAAYSLAFQYANGWGVPQDYSEAARWFRRAGELGLGYQGLASLLRQGLGVPKDSKRAIELYHETGDSNGATYGLFEEEFHIPKFSSWEEGTAWFRTRADSGDPVAQAGLGLRYEFGIGLPRNWLVAYALYNLVATSSSPTLKDLPDFTYFSDPHGLLLSATAWAQRDGTSCTRWQSQATY